MENVSLWSVSLTMSGILWADWLGRGHADKMLPFLTRIYLAVTDKQDSGKVRPTDTGPHERKITTLRVRQVKTTRTRYRSTPIKGAHCEWRQNPLQTSNLSVTQHSETWVFCPRNFGLWIQCRAHTQLPLNRLSTRNSLHTGRITLGQTREL